jgi:hypothetical protein
MTKEELIHKYLHHREWQAIYSLDRYEAIQSENFEEAIECQLMMHYHQDESNELWLDGLYRGWYDDLMQARVV